MLHGLLHYVLGILRERGSALLGLARKGLSALHSLLGGAHGLIRGLLKKVLSLLAPNAPSARTTTSAEGRDPLDSMMRRVQQLLKEQASQPPDEPEGPRAEELRAEGPPAAPTTAMEPDPTAPTTSSAAATTAVATTEAAEITTDPVVTQARVPGRAAGDELARIAPVLGRVVLRALSRKRLSRSERLTAARAAAHMA